MDATQMMLEGTPLWVQIAYLVIAALVGALLIPYLKQKAAAAKAERDKFDAERRALGAAADTAVANLDRIRADTNKIESEVTVVTRNGVEELASQVEEFLHMRAADIAERRFPVLCQKVLADGLGKNDVQTVKDELRSWGKELKEEALSFFKVLGLDLLDEFGDKYLDQLIEHVANRVSPFPGKDTAVELLTSKGPNWIINRGVQVVRHKYLDGKEAPDAGNRKKDG